MNKYKYVYLAMIFIFVVSCEQKPEKQSIIKTSNKSVTVSVPIFLIYGEFPPVNYIEEKDSLETKKFGFKIKRVADCEITNKLVDSVKTINQKNNEIMQSKYGNNWKQKFEEVTKLRLAIPEID